MGLIMRLMMVPSGNDYCNNLRNLSHVPVENSLVFLVKMVIFHSCGSIPDVRMPEKM